MKKLILLLALLLPIPAVAQSWEVGTFKPLTWAQVLAIDTTTNGRVVTRNLISTNPFQITCTTNCWVAFGFQTPSNMSPQANATTGMFLVGAIPYTFAGMSGARIAVLANSGTGLAIVQELAR